MQYDEENVMKKIISVFCFIAALLLLCSCSHIFSEKTVTDISEYGNVWETFSRSYGNSSELFPKTLENLDVQSFQNRLIQYQIVGDGWQVELKVKYDKAAFDAEVERISKLTEGSPVHGKSEYFSLPTYASVWNGESRCSFEYAVVREEENTISYIYLQQLYESDFSISSDCIPRNYKYPSEYKEKTFLISNYLDIHS